MSSMLSVSRVRPRLFAASLVVVACAGMVTQATAQQASGTNPISVGTNVNMVAGPAGLTYRPSDLKIDKIEGDPYLQRQNEPSMACSSRNPVNCLASANDYRLVGTPGVADGKVTGDAWLGVFWSHDEGQTWRSTLLPGFPLDGSAAGAASPIAGAGAAADPTVRAGTNGLFYLSGVAFNRNAESTGTGGKVGKMFVATYVDDNNTQTPGAPVRYLGTVVVDGGSSGQFLDKPWIATDIPRGKFGYCTIPASGGVAAQTVPAGNVYVAYSVFLGSGNNVHSKILFTRSTDCGQTWDSPQKLNESFSTVSQSAVVSVNPVNGAVMVTWRQFGDPNNADPGRILVAQSTDFGKTFGKTILVADLGLSNASVAFDQPSLPVPGDPAPTQRMFRTNGFPTACIGTDGVYRVAWAQRWNIGNPTLWPSRVVLTASTDGGQTWTPPAPIDNSGGYSHQFMPAMACTANRATVLWYDQRKDLAVAIFGRYIVDVIPPGMIHTLDVRAAQNDPAGASGSAFLPSTQVSRYQWAVDTKKNALVQLEYNPVNWPLYAKGTTPFLGDYIDVVPARIFKAPPDGVNGAKWTYNTDPDDASVLHAVWTDNRDILNRAETWDAWSPPGTAGCIDAVEASKRNQNIYTARLSRGLVVGVEGNSRLLPGDVKTRSFAVFVQNASNKGRKFQLTISGTSAGLATFDAATLPTATPAPPPGTLPTTSLPVVIGPLSTIARTVFVPATQVSPVILNVVEVNADGLPRSNGLTGSAVINSDGTAPPPIDGTVYQAEQYTSAISTGKVVKDYANPAFGQNYTAPTFIDPTYIDTTAPTPTYIDTTFINPTYIDPTFIDPTYIDPTYIDPTYIDPTYIDPTYIDPTYIDPTYIDPTYIDNTYLNPTYIDPTYIDPTYIDPTYIDRAPGDPPPPTILNGRRVTDVTWQVTNTGNVATGFNIGALAASLPQGAAVQLLVTRLYPKPGVTAGCGLGQQYSADILAVINNPALTPAGGGNPLSQSVTNATFALAAGDKAVVTLRVAHNGGFDGRAATLTNVAQAVNPANTGAIARAVPAVVVPQGVVTAEADVPTGASSVVFPAVTAFDALGSALAPTCTPASGAPFAFGTTTVKCSATDSTGLTGSSTFTVSVTDTVAPSVSSPGNLTVGASGPLGAAVSFSVTASDTVDGSLPVTCAPASGSTFAIGTTTVSCTAKDAANNTGSATFTVTVRDTTAPVVTGSALTVEATSGTGAVVNYTGVSVVDAVDGAIASFTCIPASGSMLPVGATVVNCSASDSAGNKGAGSFTVNVVDTTAPVLTVPAAVGAEATGAPGAVVGFTVSAVDLVDGARPVTCVPAAGATFPLGATPVNCSATDAHGNTRASAFIVTVVDTTPPVLTLPASATAEATGAGGAVVSFSTSAVDLVDGARPVACVPASGSTFPLGGTVVNCSTSDSRGNPANGSFTVTVRDTTPPALKVPAPINAEATSSSGAAVSYAATWTDLVSGSGTATCLPVSGSTFAIGTTAVSCSARDASGNTGTAAFTVTVVDTTAPSVTAAVSPNTLLWSPNKTMTPVTISGAVRDVTLKGVTYRVVDEYGYIQPTGTVTVSSTGSYSFVVKLEAWRQGTDSNGRLYTIYVTATDAYGHVTSATTTVTVPHN
jgi:hypothetical protein